MGDMGSYIKAIESRAVTKIKEQRGVTRPVFFSDSILLVTNDVSKESLNSILSSCSFLIWTCMKMGIPVKGAISRGMQTADFNKSLHFGKALIDAYLLQDDLFFYGIVIHHTVEPQLRDILTRPLRNECAFYDAPFKKIGKIKHYVIDWTIVDEFKGYEDKPKCLDIVTKLYSTVSGGPRKYVDNTVEFVRAMTPSGTSS